MNHGSSPLAFEVFAAVVSRQGFARAAEALDTSPANVTRYVADLEAHLGTRLLHRHSRKLSLTESGEALYERARSILEDVAEAEAIAGSAALQPSGRLRINAPVSFGIRHLAPLWPLFLQRHPQVELDVSLIDRVVDIVDEGFDLAIRISRAGSMAQPARKLASSHNIPCAAPAYLRAHGEPATPADLAQHACIGYSYSATGDDWHFLDAEDARTSCVCAASCTRTTAIPRAPPPWPAAASSGSRASWSATICAPAAS